MVNIIAQSEAFNFLDFGRLEDFFVGREHTQEDLLEGFDQLLIDGSLSPTSLTATKFVFEGDIGAYDFRVTVSGSGISPVGSLEQLEAAFEAGLATGQFDKIVVRGSKAPTSVGESWIPASNFLTFNLKASGYTLTSGNVKVSIDGTLPSSMNDFFDIIGLAEQLGQYDSLTQTQKNALIQDLNDFDFDGIGLEVDGQTVFELSFSSTKLSLELMGYTLSIVGTNFPDDLGDGLELLMDIGEAIDGDNSVDLSNLSGAAITRVIMTNPDGDNVLRTIGTFGDSDLVTLDVINIDGVRVPDPVVGGESENFVSSSLEPGSVFVPGDVLNGTNKRDFIYGVSGNDTLNGHAGRDTLFGGSGNDRLDGGNGDDVLNPGSNLSGDTVLGSKGSDTIIYSDNGPHGFQTLTYENLTRSVNVNINAKTNTGTVKKGAQGTDTIVDVAVPMDDASKGFTAGLSIRGTDFNDRFRLVTTRDDWASITGGEGRDTYSLVVQRDAIVRVNFSGTQGVEVDLSTGIIANDGHGNVETITVTNNGGEVELNGSSLNDRFIGGAHDDRFILGQGTDFADGQGGVDMVRYDRFGVDEVTVNLQTGTATGTWGGSQFTHTLQNIEDVRGSRNADDLLIGSAAANTMQGRGGDDELRGRDGNDRLFGEAGNDTLIGGGGVDRLTGGEGDDRLTGNGGRDQFLFNAAEDEGTDTITDFQDGRDRIRIEGAEFNDLRLSTLSVPGQDDMAIIQLASGTVIQLEDMSHTDLDASDFIFV